MKIFLRKLFLYIIIDLFIIYLKKLNEFFKSILTILIIKMWFYEAIFNYY